MRPTLRMQHAFPKHAHPKSAIYQPATITSTSTSTTTTATTTANTLSHVHVQVIEVMSRYVDVISYQPDGVQFNGTELGRIHMLSGGKPMVI